MNGSNSSAIYSHKREKIPLWRPQQTFFPDPVDDINKWDTLQPTDNFDLDDFDDNE